MPNQNLHDQVLRAYILHLTLRDALLPPEDLPPTELLLRLQADMEMYRAIKNTRYLNTQTSIPKSGSLHLAWEYARRPEHHDLFIQMLCYVRSRSVNSRLTGTVGSSREVRH